MSQYTTTRRPQKRTAKPHPLDGQGIPWIFRPVKGEVELKLPYKPGNRKWIRSGFGTGITLREKLVPATNSWTISRTHFDLARRRIAEEFGSVEVYEQFKRAVTCNDKCKGASKDNCVCSCQSLNHGGGRFREKGWITRGEVPIGTDLIQKHSTYYLGRRPVR